MERRFNTAGPCKPQMHYTIDPLGRIEVEEVLSLVDAERYFVLHAPRQTGKTTCLLALAQRLNEGGRYRALYVNIEAAQAARGDVDRGMAVVCDQVAAACRSRLGDERVGAWLAAEGRQVSPGSRLQQLLSFWSAVDTERPAVLLLDEVDALVGDTLISLLRQIRAGYT